MKSTSSSLTNRELSLFLSQPFLHQIVRGRKFLNGRRNILLTLPAFALIVPLSATGETRESYLERLRVICEVECMQPRELLRAARARASQDKADIAIIMDVGSVSVWGDMYLLHSQAPPQVGNASLGNRMLPSRRPNTRPNSIVVEMNEDTFFDLLNLEGQEAQVVKEDMVSEEGEIIVQGDADRELERRTFARLRMMFRNRRIVARGRQRLEVAFVGARRDFRRTKLFIELDEADNLAVLPRYDRNGTPVFDGPLAGLREAYVSEVK